MLDGCNTAIAKIQKAESTSITKPISTPLPTANNPLRYLVTYKVTGDGIELAHITYKTASGLIAEEELEPHFKTTYAMDLGDKLRLTAEVIKGNGTIGCIIYLNDEIVDQQESTGGPGISVSCEGTVR